MSIKLQVIGFDAKTLLHSAHRGKSGVEDISDDKLMKEIDAFMESEERMEEMGHEEHLRRLLELNDKAALIHHPVAKVKRQKLLKQVKWT